MVTHDDNPYRPPATLPESALDPEWPHLPFRDARRVRQLAKDADRIWLSMIGCVMLCHYGPFIFAIVFFALGHAHQRLSVRYPQLCDPTADAPKSAHSFAGAGKKFRNWRNAFLFLLAVEWVLVFSSLA